MKKLITLFLVATVLSCSNDDHENQNVASVAENSGSVLDGSVLSFKNEESFVKEYSDLATLSSNDLQVWISSKRVVSLLNTSDASLDIEGDIIPESRVIYSDALKSILNAESKVKIADKVLWLNDRTFYLLSENEINKSLEELIAVKGSLSVYGKLLSVSESTKSLTDRRVIPNENRIKTIVTGEENFNVPGSRVRHVFDLYNETIVLGDVIQSSKMYLRSTLQYRSCSSFRCTWKTTSNPAQIDTYSLRGTNSVLWKFSYFTDNSVIGSETFLLATWNPSNLPAPIGPDAWFTNFQVSGPVKFYLGDRWYEIELSWY